MCTCAALPDGQQEIFLLPTDAAFDGFLRANKLSTEGILADPEFLVNVLTVHVGVATDNSASDAYTASGNKIKLFTCDSAKFPLTSIPTGINTARDMQVQGPLNMVPIETTINCDGYMYVLVAGAVLEPLDAGLLFGQPSYGCGYQNNQNLIPESNGVANSVVLPSADVPVEVASGVSQEIIVPSVPPEASAENGGTNIGVIVGGVIGGVVVLILLVLLIVWLVLRRKNKRSLRGRETALESQTEIKLPCVIGKPVECSFQMSKGHYSSGVDQPVTNVGGDAFKMWLNGIVGGANASGQGKRKEFEFSQVEIGDLIKKESYGMVRYFNICTYILRLYGK